MQRDSRIRKTPSRPKGGWTLVVQPLASKKAKQRVRCLLRWRFQVIEDCMCRSCRLGDASHVPAALVMGADAFGSATRMQNGQNSVGCDSMRPDLFLVWLSNL